MKHLKYLLVAGSLLSFFPLAAANSLFEESEISSSYEEEEGSVSTLEKELSLLDREFQEFEQEIFSLEEPAQPEEIAQVVAVESLVAEEALPQEIVFETPVVELAEPTPTPVEFVEVPWVQSVVTEEVALEEIQEPESVASEVAVVEIAAMEPLALRAIQEFELQGEEESLTVDFKQAFNGSPLIYSLLLILSLAAVSIWLYVLLTLGRLTKSPQLLSQRLHNQLMANHFDEALALCQASDQLLSKMIASGIHSRKHGLTVMVDAMKAEGKRVSVKFWQKIGMLNDIAIIAPMFGLLGTVLGMFYAFYHINRSVESVSTLFDGLGVSVGTTVAGLIVAILSLILHSIAKYRLVRALAIVENEAHTLAHLIDDRTTLCNRG